MASFFDDFGPGVRVLEAGAGVGTLLAAVVAEACGRPTLPRSIDTVAFEIDPILACYLRDTLSGCEATCRRARVRFHSDLTEGDFIEAGVELLGEGHFGPRHTTRFTHAILNPPYKKLNSDSKTRLLLRSAGIETSNLYSAFVALAVQLLEPGGEMVAITPRSFCNGPYFRPFREFLLRQTAVKRFHLFDSRTAAFSDDEVLQENVIFHVVKGRPQGNALVSSNNGPDDQMLSTREVPFAQMVKPQDPERFIHLVSDDRGQQIADAFSRLPAKLADLGLSVSTGKVVDFRAKEFLRREPGVNTRPLIYPTHFADGAIRWPKAGKKPNALVDEGGTSELWMPRGRYVLVKRFSSKEERRRVVAALFDPKMVPADKIGFENHLNVFHARGAGLDQDVAQGLAAFLNSTFVDAYVRQFNGHTQVNATDLRSLRYPALTALAKLGKRRGVRVLNQHALDEVVGSSMFGFSATEAAGFFD
jgi:adenine-specific DNA-methyltransferase